jgi:hypothetical protein
MARANLTGTKGNKRSFWHFYRREKEWLDEVTKALQPRPWMVPI